MGSAIAYNRIFRNFRTWKRYTGGMHQNVWTYNFKTGTVRTADRLEGHRPSIPCGMASTIYFVSDRGPGYRMQLCGPWTPASKQIRQVTHFTDYDVDWPSLGDNGIVFQEGGSLYVMDLPSEQVHKLSVDVPDDGINTNVRYVDASKFIQSNGPGRRPQLRHRRPTASARCIAGARRPVHPARRTRQDPRPDPDLQRQGGEPQLVAGRQVDRLRDRRQRRGPDRHPSLRGRSRADPHATSRPATSTGRYGRRTAASSRSPTTSTSSGTWT